jgi:hypothetical protein
MTSIDRTIQFIEFKGIKKSSFYKNTGLSNGYLDKVKELGADKILSIISFYTELNIEWLITGEGEMLKQEGNNETLGSLNESNTGHSTNHTKDELIMTQRKYINKLEQEIDQIKRSNPDSEPKSTFEDRMNSESLEVFFDIKKPTKKNK